MSQFSSSQSGNILIYILGAIFLLGLLVVISKGSTTPGAGIDAEQLMIRVSEVQNYGQELEQAVAYVMTNGHSEVDIRFAHPDADSAYGVITDTPTRQIFSRDGGGARYREPPNDIQITPTDWQFNADNRAPLVGSTEADLIAVLSNVTEDFCLKMNDANDIDNPSNAPPQDSDDFEVTTFFTGAYNSSPEEIGDSSLNGTKKEGCIEGSGTPAANSYHYYRVLLAR
jgi:hypothetical protein